jgi:hypothetical protein
MKSYRDVLIRRVPEGQRRSARDLAVAHGLAHPDTPTTTPMPSLSALIQILEGVPQPGGGGRGGHPGTGQPGAGQPIIIFSVAPTPDKAIIHDSDTFQVQWKAFNAGQVDSQDFTDLLVITNIPEGCPGSDDQDHPVVYDSETAGNPEDFKEQELPAHAEGSLMQTTVGPFAPGSYRLTVTLDKDLSNTTSFNCIDIIPDD